MGDSAGTAILYSGFFISEITPAVFARCVEGAKAEKAVKLIMRNIVVAWEILAIFVYETAVILSDFFCSHNMLLQGSHNFIIMYHIGYV